MIIPFKLPLILSLFLVLSIQNKAVAQTDTCDIQLNIFPNPNSGTFYITVVNKKNYYSQLYAMDGSLVKTFYLRNGLNYISIGVPPGVYLLKVGKEDPQQQFKIVIK